MGNKARKLVSLVLVVGLFFQQAGFVQAAGALSMAGYLNLSGSSAISQDKFRPVQMRYFSYEPASDNFKILLDKGDLNKLEDKKAKEEAQTLLSYFLVGVTLPDDMFWVNLRPDSQDQIIDPLLEKTEVGRIMLAADLQLKKDTSRMTSPQTPEGKAYWDKLYKKAGELFGSENIAIPTITRPWIVPGEIIVRESENSAYVYKAGLKVMLEEDYLSSQSSAGQKAAVGLPIVQAAVSHQQFKTNYSFSDPRLKELNQYSTQLIKELIIPKLTKEINSSKRYANLRQVYYSLILSRWFKLRFSGKSGTYASLINTKDLTNLTSEKLWDKSEYFTQYQQSFAKGEYNLKEQVYTTTGQIVRSYVSGGLNWASSAINPENGVILKGDVSNTIGMVKISGSAAKPLNIGLQLAVAASSSMSIEDDYYEKRRADELEYVERRGRALRGVPDFGNEGLDNYLTPAEREERERQKASDRGVDYEEWKKGKRTSGSPIEDIQSYIERVNGNLYSLENNRGKPLTTDDLKPAREKFGLDGKVLPFKGLTTIAWIRENTPLYEQLKSVQENISRELLDSRLGTSKHPIFAPVVPASLHMTIYDLITGGLNGKEDISLEKYQEICQKVKEAFEEIVGTENINMEVRDIGTFPLKPNLLMAKCYPKTPEDLKKILQIRRKIEDKTGIKSPFPFVAHITLGYLVNPLSVEEYERFLDVMKNYNYGFGTFTFSSLDFTHFSDMNNFIPVLTKDLSILQDVLRASKMLVNTNLEAVSSEVNESVALFSNYLQELKVSLKKKGINLEQYIRIDAVINGIREDRGKESKKTKFVKKLKGESVDIVDENDLPVEVTEAGFTHIFGLRHRTANAFVFTPDGKLFLQRRVHNKAEAKTFSIAGGHVVHGMTYAEAAGEELLQELKLYQIEEKLEGKLILIGQEGQFRNDDAKSPNNEFRSLYTYVLTEKEWAHVKNMKNEIDVERAKRTETEFEKWIEEEQKKPEDGLGEVWGYHVVELSEVINSENVHVTEKYSDGLKKQDVGFSKDLLLPLANGIAPIRDGTQAINPMQEIRDKLHLSSSSLSPQFSNSKKDIYIPKSADEAYAAVIMVITEIMKKYNIFKSEIDKDKVREALSTGTVTDIGYVLFDYDSDAALYTWDSRVAVNFSERVLMLGNEKYAYNIDSVKYEVTSHFNEDLVKTQLRTMLYNLDWYNVFLLEEEKTLKEDVEKHNLLAGSGSDSIPSEAEETAYQKTQEAYWEILRKIKLMTDAKIDEIINWVKSESSKNFKGKDVRILKEISPGVMVIMANERDGGIVEKLELAYNTTVVSFSKYLNSSRDVYIPKSVDEAYDAVIMTLIEILKDHGMVKPNIDKDKVRKALSYRGDAICIGSVSFGFYPRSDEVTVKFSEGMFVIGGIEDYHYGDTTRYKITRPFNEELLKNTLLTILHELDWVYNAVLTEEDKRTIELVEKRNFLAGPGTGSNNYMDEPGYLALQGAYSAVHEKMKTLTNAKITEIVNWVKSEPNKNLKGEDVYILKRTDLGVTIVGSIDRGIAKKFGFTYETTSSPMQSLSDQKTGGIDFRALPMSVQPMGSFRGLDFGLPRLSWAEIEQINIESQIGQIRDMLRAGISPSGARVKELAAACAQKGQISAYADDLLACIGDILKLEEEIAKESSPELKEALVLADLGGNYFQL